MHNFKLFPHFLLLSPKNVDCNSSSLHKLLLPSLSSAASRARRGFYHYAPEPLSGNEYVCYNGNNKFELQNGGPDIHKEGKCLVLPVQDVVSDYKCEERFGICDEKKSKFTNVGSSPESSRHTFLTTAGHCYPNYKTKHLETNELRRLVEFNDLQFVDEPKQNKQPAERNAVTETPFWLTYTSYNNMDHARIVATLLMNCTNVLELYQIHAHVLRTNMLENHPSSFYWNIIIRSYTRLEVPRIALFVYIDMLRAGILPDCYTLPIVFKALSLAYAFDLGLQLHSVAIRLGFEFDQYSESGLISLYSKIGDLECACKVFEQNHNRKLGSWNAIIAGLSQGGRAKEAVNMFIKLRQSGLEPDDFTIVSVTSACGSLGNLELSLQMHKFVFQVKVTGKSNILMLNSLIDMYGKCGRMDLAMKVFSNMGHRNVSSWTSLIVGYAMHGQVKQALENFQFMREAGVPPNQVTFVGVLSACVHGGMINEGKHYFDMMKNVYGFKPQLPHYGCMVDLLSKAGLLEEARRMIEEMPMKANSIIWGCLIGGCEKHGNVEIGEWAGKHLQELEPWNDGVYVVLSNIYATNGMWKEAQKMRDVMKQRQLAKVPGYSLAATDLRFIKISPILPLQCASHRSLMAFDGSATPTTNNLRQRNSNGGGGKVVNKDLNGGGNCYKGTGMGIGKASFMRWRVEDVAYAAKNHWIPCIFGLGMLFFVHVEYTLRMVPPASPPFDLGFVITRSLHRVLSSWPELNTLLAALNTVFVAMQTSYILWTWLIEGRLRPTLAAVFTFTCRGILGYSTQLPLPQGFLGSEMDFPVGNISFFLFFSGHVAGSVIASLDMRRVQRWGLAWTFDFLNLLQVIRLLGTRGHYTIDLAVGVGAGFLFDSLAGHYEACLQRKNLDNKLAKTFT